MLTVVALTDELLVETGLRLLLGQNSEFELLSSCAKPAEFIRTASEHQPDILLCALHHGMDLKFTDLSLASPRSAIVLFSRDITPDFAHQALNLGVRGFISGTADIETLFECLRTVARGDLWMERSLSMLLLDIRPLRLSKRQAELLRLLTQGLKNKEIAEALQIAEGTVKSYLTALFEKVGAKDRFELALFGLKYLNNAPGETHLPALTRKEQMRSYVDRINRRTVA